MSTALAWGVLFGATLGLGLWSIVAMLPRFGGPTLADRVAPYLVDVSEGARHYVEKRFTDPLPILGRMLGPVLRRLSVRLSAALGGNAAVQRNLDRAGVDGDVQHFRLEQLLWCLAGGAAGLTAAGAAAIYGTLPLAVIIALPLATGVTGLVLRDTVLSRQATARSNRITAELPTVLEFLSLSLSAGEGILDGLRRMGTLGSGELSTEFRAVLAAVHTGVPLAAALTDVARRADIPALTRCVEQLVAALERGSPLAEVLRAQAQDARDEAKRGLLEVAGKKEVAMLVPLVFLILPLSILFAIFPGIFVLQAGF
ncbi:tight adherence protein C [Okibacterium sp. HSC-33S16]|uniref:type II secretion system F family protein n=1 Tax=Okibacterium sp. HSC-33S16 TaxID=2910965 RepID=UPI00209F0634|nr:type II secretion system F family protein [Okibacterium sp. HSC-33S16]MCP2030464.1 tight adherence protein C [Okibacterium sp. HSC-33S16]